MPASRLALLTLVLGLALGTGVGFVLGGDSGRVVEAADTTIERSPTSRNSGTNARSSNRASTANDLASIGRVAAPGGATGVTDAVLQAAARDRSAAVASRVAATIGADGDAAGTGTITGTAYDADGAPLEGVTIVATNGDNPYASRAKGSDTSAVGRAWTGPLDVDESLEDSARSLLKSRRTQRTATTGPDGQFELTGLRNGRHSLAAYYDGLVFSGQSVHAGEAARFVGQPVAVFHLDLRLPDGTSPSEALVLVGDGDRPDGYRWSQEEPTIRMSRQAESFKALAGNVHALDWRNYVSDFVSEIEAIDLEQDGEGPHTIELAARSLLRVTLEDNSGIEPRLDPWVKYVEASKAKSEDLAAAFENSRSLTRGWGQDYTVADLANGSYVIGAGRGGEQPEVTSTVEVTGGLSEHHLVLGAVDMSRYLVVRCTGPSGQKLASVTFRRRVEYEGGSSSGGTSSMPRGPGEFWLALDDLTDGKEWNEGISVELNVLAKGYGELSSPITQGQKSIDLAFQPSAELLVRVDGDLTPGFTVGAVSIVKDKDGKTRNMRSSRANKRVDGDGVVRITGLQPGLVRVELKKAGENNRWSPAVDTQEVTIRPGSQEVSFMAPTYHEVVLYAPDLAEGTHFWMSRKQEGSQQDFYYGNNGAQLDAEHRAHFKDVAAGEYTVQCWGGSDQSQMDITVPSGEILFVPKQIVAYRVKAVTEGKLAARAGLAVGDVVVAVNGHEFVGSKFFQRLSLDLESGPTTLTLQRGGGSSEVTLDAAEKGGNTWEQIGVEWEPVNE